MEKFTHSKDSLLSYLTHEFLHDRGALLATVRASPRVSDKLSPKKRILGLCQKLLGGKNTSISNGFQKKLVAKIYELLPPSSILGQHMIYEFTIYRKSSTELVNTDIAFQRTSRITDEFFIQEVSPFLFYPSFFLSSISFISFSLDLFGSFCVFSPGHQSLLLRVPAAALRQGPPLPTSVQVSACLESR